LADVEKLGEILAEYGIALHSQILRASLQTTGDDAEG
jgi:hypothetical protein